MSGEDGPLLPLIGEAEIISIPPSINFSGREPICLWLQWLALKYILIYSTLHYSFFIWMLNGLHYDQRTLQSSALGYEIPSCKHFCVWVRWVVERRPSSISQFEGKVVQQHCVRFHRWLCCLPFSTFTRRVQQFWTGETLVNQVYECRNILMRPLKAVKRGHGFTMGTSVAALGWPYLDDETDMEQLVRQIVKMDRQISVRSHRSLDPVSQSTLYPLDVHQDWFKQWWWDNI